MTSTDPDRGRPDRQTPELETITSHDDVAGLGMPSDSDEIDDTLALELEFLTSLVWAPDSMTTAATHALVGDAALRAAGPPADALPLASPPFLSADHAEIFTAVAGLVDAGTPVTPTLLSSTLNDGAPRSRLRPLLLEIAAPSRGRDPLPGGADVPHLASALVDGWYRRGYLALLARMSHVVAEARTAELAGHWAALTAHQQTAERRWSTVRRRLSEI